MKPKVVTSTDEADLAKQLEKLEQENAEVSHGNYFGYLAVIKRLLFQL